MIRLVEFIYLLDDAELNLMAHCLGVDISKHKRTGTLPRECTSNKLVLSDDCEYQSILDKLYKATYLKKTGKIDIYGGARIYTVTPNGLDVFYDEWKKRYSKVKIYEYQGFEFATIALSEKQYLAIGVLLALYEELRIRDEFIWNITQGKGDNIILEIENDDDNNSNIRTRIRKNGSIVHCKFDYLEKDSQESRDIFFFN